VIVQESLPEDVPGFGDLENRRRQFHAIDSSALKIAKDVESALDQARVPREAMVESDLRFCRRVSDRGRDYFIVNRGEKAVDGWVPLATPFASAVILDPRFADRAGAVRTRQGEIYLQLQPGESCIVRTFAEAVNAPTWPYRRVAGEGQTLTGTWRVHFAESGPALPADFETTQLASWTARDDVEAKRFAGTARHTIEFDLPDIAAAQDWLLDLGRVCDSARVSVNGRDVATVWSRPFELRVGPFLKHGRNELTIEVTNLAANRIADLDRRGVNWKSFYEINFVNKDYKPFDASKWPPRDSGLLGPVRLIPLRELNPATAN